MDTAWESFWKLIRMLVVMAIVVLLATHFRAASLSHAVHGAVGGARTIDALLQRLAHEVPLPTDS